MTIPSLFTPAVIRQAKPARREYTLHDAHVAGFGLRVQPSGAKSWVLRLGRRRITIGPAEEIPLAEARAQASKLIAGETPPPLSARALTFNALADQFVAAKQGVYKPDTLASCQVYLDTQLRPALGKLIVERLTTPEIADWFYRYSQIRPGGANQALGLLVTMLNFARRQNLVPREMPDPCAPIRRNRRQARGRLLSAAQITALGKALDSSAPQHRDAADAIQLILLTGCRSGEILRLRWSEVLSDKLALETTKTGPRDVLLSLPAKKLLATRRKTAITPFVFASPKHPGEPIGKIDHAWSPHGRGWRN
jgi:integrase